jgi:acyl-CoA synthetase (AMP-forming)/AMP-acid ligase II
MVMTDNLGTLLAEACRSFAGSPAIESGGAAVDYAALATWAETVAQKLRDCGLTANEPVLVQVANAAQDLTSFMGVWQAGGVVVPLAFNNPSVVVKNTQTATGARLLVTGGNGVVTQIGDTAPESRAILSGAALIIFTSGSTGRPKGVVLSHKGFAGKLRTINSRLDFTRDTRAMLVLQMTFVFGTWVSLLTLMKGGVLLMHARFDPLAILTALGERRISDAAFVPTMLRKLLAADPAVLGPLAGRNSLKRILTGGEPLDRALAGRVHALMPNASIVDIYGLTETCSSDFFCAADEEVSAGTIGQTGPGVRFRIADANGIETPVDTTGELQIDTPFIMSGYLDEPELTRAAFAGRFFRSGDLARRRADGRVELVGRTKELIMRGGAKIAPLEIDQLLAQHPAVAAALTVGIPDTGVGERIHVLVVPHANVAISEPELRAWIADRAERYKRPDVYHIGTELPLGRTGKADRNALREKLRDAVRDETTTQRR